MSYLSLVSLNLDIMAKVLTTIFDYKYEGHKLGVEEQTTRKKFGKTKRIKQVCGAIRPINLNREK